MRRPLALLVLILGPVAVLAQAELGKPELDRSKPVPSKSEVIAAWRKRQDAIRTFRFDWSEQQTHVRGWIPNPRFAFPAMFADRTETVSKSLTVDGGTMRYSLTRFHRHPLALFEQRVMIDLEIDHTQDRKWGWVPGGWRVTEKLSDGTKRVLSVAKVTHYTINEEAR